MKQYFTLTTDVFEGIDNVTIYGRSIYSPIDVVRLISAHAKYPYTLTFQDKPVSEPKPLKTVLNMLDEMVLHKKAISYKEIFDRYDKLIMNPTAAYAEGGYYHLDFSGGEFKKLSKDRTAMLEENRKVYEVMSFLFKHGCEFEYEGSRAKLRIPIKHYSNRHLIYYMNNWVNHSYLETPIECGVYHIEKVEEIVEVEAGII